MQFYKHNNLQGIHAPFSASQSSWLRYDDEKATQVYLKKQAAKMGTRLHAWAKETIDLGIKQPRSNKTIYKYINDAIGYRMSTEVVLYYSDYFFGTADAISFSDDEKLLRIHDLKTGEHPASIEQLMVYAALFCLEYHVRPGEIDMELRIYQNDEIDAYRPQADEIAPIMDKIVHFNKMLIKLEGEV